MSSTRKAEPGSAFRQERYASSPEFERGLMANLVARRCELIERAEDRDLVWSLQLCSHWRGGLNQVALDLLAKYPEANATPSMRKFGMKPGQIYTASQVKAAREEFGSLGSDRFLLRGELSYAEAALVPDVPGEHEDMPSQFRTSILARRAEVMAGAQKRPEKYTADDFVNACRATAFKELAEYLARLCLDPEMQIEGGPWYWPDLVETLRAFMREWIEERRKADVVTELGKQVRETLEYAYDGRCMVLIDGLARTGKTHAAKAWCEQNPGRARYVQVPSTNDEIGFYRAIAASLGVSINLNSKAQELRGRIEDVLHRCPLIIVFDEAHYLWPSTTYRDALPGRLSWIMTALVNYGVPVALVTTPQFLKTQKLIEGRSCWTSEQFIGRIYHYQKLPDTLSMADLEAVAKAVLPEGDKGSITTLVKYAKASAKYLAAIDTAARRARFLASKDGRKEASFEDVKRAIRESVIPSDGALAQALTAAGSKRRASAPAAKPVESAGSDPGEEDAAEAQGRGARPVSYGQDRQRCDLVEV